MKAKTLCPTFTCVYGESEVLRLAAPNPECVYLYSPVVYVKVSFLRFDECRLFGAVINKFNYNVKLEKDRFGTNVRRKITLELKRGVKRYICLTRHGRMNEIKKDSREPGFERTLENLV